MNTRNNTPVIESKNPDFILNEGEAISISLPLAKEHRDITDLMLGLSAPGTGDVFFRGASWKNMTYEEQTKARGMIKVFRSGTAFLNNLDLIENITLSELHHTLRPAQEIHSEAEKLCGDMEIMNYINCRPYECSALTLVRAQIAALFLGNSVLFIIEDPLQLARSGKMDYFTSMMLEKFKNGSAAVFAGHADSVPAKIKPHIAKQINL